VGSGPALPRCLLRLDRADQVDDRHYLLGCESRGSLCRRRPARSICFHTQLSNDAGRRLVRRADHQTTILNKLLYVNMRNSKKYLS
jgi:hypothetical protein